MAIENIEARILGAENSGREFKRLIGIAPEAKGILEKVARLEAQEPPLPPNPPMTPDQFFEESAYLYYKYGGKQFLPITNPKDIKLQEKIWAYIDYMSRRAISDGMKYLNADNN